MSQAFCRVDFGMGFEEGLEFVLVARGERLQQLEEEGGRLGEEHRRRNHHQVARGAVAVVEANGEPAHVGLVVILGVRVAAAERESRRDWNLFGELRRFRQGRGAGGGTERTAQADALGVRGALPGMLAEHAIEPIDELIRPRRLLGI